MSGSVPYRAGNVQSGHVVFRKLKAVSCNSVVTCGIVRSSIGMVKYRDVL